MASLTIDFSSQQDKAKLFNVLKSLSGRHSISIEKFRDGRSTNQNRYYWGIIVNGLASEFGYFRDEIHQLLRQKFLSYTRDNPRTGTTEHFVRSTTDLTTDEMEEYLESIRVWALSEFSVYLPLPNEIAGYERN
jgi:hypothetical protein